MRAVLICRREGAAALARRELSTLDRLLAPDNLEPRPPRVGRGHGALCALFNPPSVVESDGASVCLGALGRSGPDWFRSGAPFPDGAHAVVRVDKRCVELLTDAVGSRTLWYVLTPDLFVASTSQRAIAALTGAFEPSREAAASMLCTGVLGTAHGWDARVARVQPGARVTLDRTRWRLTVTEAPVAFAADREPEPLCLRRLEDAVEQALGRLSFDPDKWILPLSGGVDSRGLLLLLEQGARLQCATWGVPSALDDPLGDPKLAARLAAFVGARHRFFPIALSREPRERLIERFLVAGEGRTEQISGYLDGFAIWRTFAEQGYDGVIRGDEAFGWTAVRSEADVRRAVGFALASEVLGSEIAAALDLPEETDATLARRPGESLEAWRDRAYHSYRLPTLLAALTDLKCAYVEVANPLLADGIVRCVRSLPDRYRTDKRLWTKIVKRRSPDIPFAKRTAVFPLRDFVRDDSVIELMLEELESEAARDLLGPALAAALRRGIEAVRGARRRSERVPPKTPRASKPARVASRILRRLWHVRAEPLAPELLGFRAFLVLEICAKLKADASALVAESGRPPLLALRT